MATDEVVTTANGRRNLLVIQSVLEEFVVPRADHVHVLEIGCGTGQHAILIPGALPSVHWQPTDVDVSNFEKIGALINEHHLQDRVSLPYYLNAAEEEWLVPREYYHCVLAVFVLHLAPPETGMVVIDEAAELLESGGLLLLFGPFRREDTSLSEAAENLDLGLRALSSQFGLRDLDELISYAQDHGFTLVRLLDHTTTQQDDVWGAVLVRTRDG